MNPFRKPLQLLALLTCGVLIGAAGAQDARVDDPAPAEAPPAEVSPPPAAAQDSPERRDSDGDRSAGQHRRHAHNGDTVVTIGHDANLAADRHAQAVVAVFGSATSAGEVDDSVVAVFGDAHVSSGHVHEGVVAVVGDSYIDGSIDGDVVGVLGDVELGPHAAVKGDVVVVGGTLTRDPAATVDGDIQTILSGSLQNFDWLRPWIRHCLLFGRPLAFSVSVGWAWFTALGFLALYLLLAAAFRTTIERSVQTLETHFGQSILAAFIAVLLTPVAIALLFVTVIGIAAVPFLLLLLLCMTLFGKAVMLAAIGGKLVRAVEDPTWHLVLSVLIGGIIVLLLYTIPIVGFVVYNVLGLIGLGVTICTLLLMAQAARQARTAAAASRGPVTPPPAAARGPAGGFAASAAAHAAGGAAPGAAAADASSTGGGGGAGEAASGQVGPVTYAGFWLRMGALLLDVLLVSIVLHTISHSHQFSLVILAGYGAVMWKLKSATVGGIICGCQVVRADGRPLDWTTAIVRALACFLSLAVIGLGFIWIAIDEDRQAWHDKIAGTIVIRPPKGASLL